MRCLLFVFMLMTLSAGAQNDWENLDVLQKNRMRSHAFYIPFDNREQALVWDVENSSRYLSLNGGMVNRQTVRWIFTRLGMMFVNGIISRSLLTGN